ncbi:MAG: YtxH domain-containing protein [Candidatus Limnocylindria bacterium]
MAVSDDLTKLAERAKEAETRYSEVREEARTDLEQNVESSRESAQEHAAKLRSAAEKSSADISGGLSAIQNSWNEHIARIRRDLEGKKAEHDVHKAQRRADDAEAYASFAIDLAYSAVAEAEYAALDAALARMDADEMSDESATSGVAGSAS